MKVGLLIIATNKYISFLNELINTADKYFLPGIEVTYYVFTDKSIEELADIIKIRGCETFRPIVRIGVEHKSWPWMTLGRYKIFSRYEHILLDQDYLFY